MDTLSEDFFNGMLFSLAGMIRSGVRDSIVLDFLREAGVTKNEIEIKCKITKYDLKYLSPVFELIN